MENQITSSSGTPTIKEMQVVPVAGYDSMLLNLSGAHGPVFTRNVVLLKDNSGCTGVGEVPGGERIRQTLDKENGGQKLYPGLKNWRWYTRKGQCLNVVLSKDQAPAQHTGSHRTGLPQGRVQGY